MPDLTHHETLPGDVDPATVTAALELWGDGVAVVGYLPGTDESIGGRRVVTGNPWTITDVVGNADPDLVPAGTVYRVERTWPGLRSPVVDFVDMPTTGGPYSVGDILADAPGTLESAALAAHRALLHRSFIHVTEDWVERCRALLALTDSRLVRMATLVDSIGVGSYATDWLAEGYLRVAGDVLQAVHGDGGSGWVDGAYLNNIFVPGGGQVTETGAWTLTAGGGVNGLARRPTVNGSGATVTFPFRGTELDLVQKRGTVGNGFGGWDYRIDAGSAVTVSAQNATADIHTTTITGLAAGEHTVQVTANNGTCRIYGARGRNATGFLLDNYGQGGRSLVNAAGGGVPVTQATESIATGVDATLYGATLRAAAPIDLFLLGCSVNDSNAASSPTEPLLDVLGQVWETARQQGPTLAEPPLPLFMIHHVGRHDADTTPEYSKHTAAFRPWAEGIGAAVIDYWTFGRNSWDYWAGLNYWGLDNLDNVHPGTVGHAAMAELLVDLLTV